MKKRPAPKRAKENEPQKNNLKDDSVFYPDEDDADWPKRTPDTVEAIYALMKEDAPRPD